MSCVTPTGSYSYPMWFGSADARRRALPCRQLDDGLGYLAGRALDGSWMAYLPGGLPAPAGGRELVDYWIEGYDWRAVEREINAFANFRTEIQARKTNAGCTPFSSVRDHETDETRPAPQSAGVCRLVAPLASVCSVRDIGRRPAVGQPQRGKVVVAHRAAALPPEWGALHCSSRSTAARSRAALSGGEHRPSRFRRGRRSG